MHPLLLMALVAFAVHRLWSYEDIFRPARKWTFATSQRKKWLKPLWCPNCFGFWAALVAVLSVHFLHTYLFVLHYALAIYPLLRGAAALYQVYPKLLMWVDRDAQGLRDRLRLQHQGAAPRPDTGVVGASVPAPEPAEEGCTECAKAKEAKEQQVKNKETPPDRRIVLVGLIYDWSLPYSVSMVLLQQARLFAQAGFAVHILCCKHAKGLPDDLPDNIKITPVLPHTTFTGAELNEAQASAAMESSVTKALMAVGAGTVIAHDILLHKEYRGHAKGLLAALETINPEGETPYSIAHYFHSSAEVVVPVPEGHRVILNSQDERFPDAHILPPCVDYQRLFGMGPAAAYIANRLDLPSADIAIIYPADNKRMMAKGVPHLIKLLSKLKTKYPSLFIRCMVANPGVHEKADLALADHMLKLAAEAGLNRDEFCLLSKVYRPAAQTGLSQQDLSALYRLCSVFICPSNHETFGLAAVEAAVCGLPMFVHERLTAVLGALEGHSRLYSYVPSEITDSLLEAVRTESLVSRDSRTIAARYSGQAYMIKLINLIRMFKHTDS